MLAAWKSNLVRVAILNKSMCVPLVDCAISVVHCVLLFDLNL